VAAEVKDAVGAADIIVTAAAAREPLLDAGWVRPGTHISAMGADAEGKQELDPALVASATLFADVVSQSITMGEYEAAYRAGLIDESRITPIGAVLNGTTGRTSDKQVIIFDSSGMALQDIAICSMALEKATKLGLATNV
jgi:ornithine cyclodeaminase